MSNNKYRKLLGNTVIFAIGTFSSKVLVFLLMPFYTRILSNAEYGTVDILVQTSNLLIPLATIGINTSVLRFALDKSSNKKAVFTTGILVNSIGFAILLLLKSPLNQIEFLDGYATLVILYVMVSSVHTLTNQFARGLGYVKLYAIDGVMRTITTIVLNILFLAVFDLGITGYLLASITSDFISIIFVSYMAELHRFISFKSLNFKLTKDMLKYGVPLIPTMLCIWIINLSDRYVITYLMGADYNGIYAVSNKVPTILVIVANIFTEAWQISSVEEGSQKGREKFFSEVANVFASLAFCAAAGIILFAKIITKMLVSDSFYSAWQFIPVLVLATVFSCLASYLNSIYMVDKKSVATLFTTLFGAILNIILNFLLIPRMGIMGAGVATLASYALMFLIRVIHSRKYLKIRWNALTFVISTLLVSAQAYFMSNESPGYLLSVPLLFVLVISLNSKSLIKAIFKILKR